MASCGHTWSSGAEHVADVPRTHQVREAIASQERTIRLDTDTEGHGGVTLMTWIRKECPGAHRIAITVSAGHAAPDEDTEGTAPAARKGTSSGVATGARDTATEPREGDGAGADESADALADALERELGIAAPTGPGKPHGRKGGSPRGAGKLDAERGGVDSETATRRGQPFGDPIGARGGEGQRGDAGVRGAIALLGGLINVPAAIRPAVELALILSEASAFGAGKQLIKNNLRNVTSVVSTRVALAKHGRRAAAEAVRAARPELMASKAFTKLTREEQKRVLRTMYWEGQRRFFDGALAAAKAERDYARRALAKLKKGPKTAAQRANLEKKLTRSEVIIEAAEVKPVAGRLPRNHQYAGKEFPREQLPPQFRDRGLRFTKDGFPDFEPYAMTLPNGKKHVRIEYTGSRTNDFRAANRLVGFKKTPLDYTWHHHEELGTMILVPTELHNNVSHTGGVSVYQHMLGFLGYGK